MTTLRVAMLLVLPAASVIRAEYSWKPSDGAVVSVKFAVVEFVAAANPIDVPSLKISTVAFAPNTSLKLNTRVGALSSVVPPFATEPVSGATSSSRSAMVTAGTERSIATLRVPAGLTLPAASAVALIVVAASSGGSSAAANSADHSPEPSAVTILLVEPQLTVTVEPGSVAPVTTMPALASAAFTMSSPATIPIVGEGVGVGVGSGVGVGVGSGVGVGVGVGVGAGAGAVPDPLPQALISVAMNAAASALRMMRPQLMD
ncbi:MAG: hypothetical protein M9907_07565 [Burkholderiaceae bacterium]|nr:hypothetical protein [Burkholderiaceae bacterium]